MEARDNHDLRWAYDVREVRIDLGVQILDIQPRDMRPRLANIVEDALQQHVNHARLCGRELAAFDLGEPPIATEEVVYHCEHELRIQYHQPCAAERQNLHQVQARRYMKRMHVLAELQHLDRRDRDFRSTAQHVEE